MIFSSIPIAEEDLLGGEPPLASAVLDHKGIDLRSADEVTRSAFDEITGIAAGLDWRHVSQGGGGIPVYCCHTEVSEKHWVYPVAGDAGQSRPIEIAYGELKIQEAAAGCDLRPIDPAHPRAGEVGCSATPCCESTTG